MFIRAYPCGCTESFQDGHVKGFIFFGGVPTRISYDNSRIAVKKFVGPRKRELTDGFLRLQNHYLFEEHFCLIRKANEKGDVENLVGYTRRNFLVPLPSVRSFEELNDHLRFIGEQVGPERHVVLMLDQAQNIEGARPHHAAAPPPYSPELNCIERSHPYPQPVG